MLGRSKKMNWLDKHYVKLIGFALLVCFFMVRNPTSKWDKTISGDGKSYYAYLSASIIYQDLDYQFIEDYEAKYYPPDKSLFKEFRQNFNGEIANKTFPGITILWLPFFLIAHFLSFLFGFEPDGYSLLYQYAIGMAAIFYVWLGLKWANGLLKSLGFSTGISAAVLITISFGTNLFYYTIHDPSLTHAYNFTLLAGILYFSRNFYLSQKKKYLVLAISLFALAIIIRPTNILMILFLPFAFNSLSELKRFITAIFKSKKNVAISISTLLLFALYPIFWWYIQTGHFIVYSYGNEGFDFSKPHVLNILFSYEKGWLVYSPIIILSTLGFIHFFKTNRLLFFTGLIGFTVLSYIFSSWWIWTYGASFGQRVFVDYYVVIAIALASGLQMISNRKGRIAIWGIIATGLIGLNILQTYQFQNGILPTIGATKTTYWHSYFKLKAIRASYPVIAAYESIKTFQTDFESESKWLTKNATIDTKAHSGQFSQFINSDAPYSGGFKGRIPGGTDFIQIEVEIYCESNSASPQLVYELATNVNNSTYNSIGLMPYLSKKEWTKFHYVLDLKNTYQTSFNTYLWNPTGDNVWVDDLKITFGKYK